MVNNMVTEKKQYKGMENSSVHEFYYNFETEKFLVAKSLLNKFK